MEQQIYTLTGHHSQLIVRVGDVAEICYYGAALTTGVGTETGMMALVRAIPYGRLDEDVPVSLNPQLARGNFGSPGLEGHRQGLDWSPAFQITTVNHSNNGLQIDSQDKQAGLALRVRLTLDRFDVLQMQQILTNTGPEDYQVVRLANTLPLPERADEVLSYYGRWVREFQQTRTRVSAGGFIQENRRGRTSHEHYPALMVGVAGFDEQQGEVWGAHLAWSGNHRLRVDVKADGRRMLQAEALYYPGEIRLQPGGTLATPMLYLSYSHHGLNGMSQQFHRHVRHTILGQRLSKPRPVHLNTWEGIYFQHDPDYILQMATAAADLGVERFIIDDGWFKGRNDDTSSLGDWEIDTEKYPDGMGALIDRVHQLGMEFGLWFEPEMINQQSDLYRQHPDWLLAVAGYHPPTGRHQYVLDLQNEAVFAYLFHRLNDFLSTYAIDYIKWDMNREIVQPAHAGVAAGVHQVERLYQLMDRLTALHPQVEIESCASGGGRIDYEVLKRTHRFWASDNNDPLERLQIQRGMSYFFPPEVMGAHIGAHHSHTTRRTQNMTFRALTALFGHMGLELDPVTASEEEKIAYRHFVGLYKQWRGVLHSGDLYRLTLDDARAQQGIMVVANDQRQALVCIAQQAMATYALSGVLRLPGLLPKGHYQLEILAAPDGFHDNVNRQPPWTTAAIILSGEWLANVGIAMPLLDPESALLMLVKQVSGKGFGD